MQLVKDAAGQGTDQVTGQGSSWPRKQLVKQWQQVVAAVDGDTVGAVVATSCMSRFLHLPHSKERSGNS
jgi:hypothetical protein